MTTTTNTTTVEKVGRRYYLRGLPYSLKDAAKAAGCTWDRDQRCWWTSRTDVAAELMGAEAPFQSRWVKLPDGEWGVTAPEGAKPGDKVVVTSRQGEKKEVTLQIKLDGAWSIVARKRGGTRRDNRGERGPRPSKLLFVGEQGPLTSRFEGSKHDRAPRRQIGEVCWLRFGDGSRREVVVVGYRPATWLRSDDAEDMGHYGLENGYYGEVHYRVATPEEAAKLAAE